MGNRKTAEKRRAVVQRILTRQDPKVTSRNMLADMLRAEGFSVTNMVMIDTDLASVGAQRVKLPGSRVQHYVLAGRNVDATLDTAVHEAEVRRRVRTDGLSVTSLEGCVPLFLRTLDTAGQLVGQPFQGWTPFGVRAVVSGHEGVVLWVEEAEVERVKLMLIKMVTGG